MTCDIIFFTVSYILFFTQDPSVDLAIQILDGTPLRPDGKVPMVVTKAKFEQKGNMNEFYVHCCLFSVWVNMTAYEMIVWLISC